MSDSGKIDFALGIALHFMQLVKYVHYIGILYAIPPACSSKEMGLSKVLLMSPPPPPPMKKLGGGRNMVFWSLHLSLGEKQIFGSLISSVVHFRG